MQAVSRLFARDRASGIFCLPFYEYSHLPSLRSSCSPGSYFNNALDKCEECGYGFYQSRSGAFDCEPCDVGS